jgi:hypothetical protein
MNLFEPLFLLLVIATIAAVATAALVALRGQGRRAGRILLRLATCAALYFAIVVAVAFASERKVYRVGEPQCSDDWCITVADARRTAGTASATWHVTLRISSRARRVTQRELDAVVYLTDDRYRRFDPLPDPSEVPIDVRVGPGESVDAARTFEVPADARHVSLVFTHEGGFPIGSLIITENQWFHKTPIVPLE